MKLFGAIFLMFALADAKVEKKIPINSEALCRIWTYSSSANDTFEYQSISKFEEDKSGIRFIKDGTLTVRQNISWCGTPPITYENYSGNWRFTSDSTITMHYKYWGGMVEEDWLIIYLSDNKLRGVITHQNRTRTK